MSEGQSKRVPFPGPASRAVSVFGLLLAAALALSWALAGCSQEGRTIQNEDIVQGVSYDVSERIRTITSDTTGSDTTWVMDVVLKVQIAYRNRCEAERSSLQLSLEGSTAEPLRVVTPIARYQADESCNVGASGDTVLTVVIQNVPVVNAGYHSFAIRGDIPVQIDLRADGTLATFPDSLNPVTTYLVRVEDVQTGAPLSGAIVRIERGDTFELLGETTTNASGDAVVTENNGGPCSAWLLPPESTPYLVKVSYSGRTMILNMDEHPARCGAPEKVIVRV
jgi:hypothetical protein